MAFAHGLSDTAIARWHAAAHGDGRGFGPAVGVLGPIRSPKEAATTRVRYYEAFLECLTRAEFSDNPWWARAPANLRHMVVAAAGGHSNSTLYSLFSPTAKTSLRAFCGEWAERDYGHRDILAWLADEVKVFSHWPYRSGWLAGLCDVEIGQARYCAETLVLVLAEWAANNVALARTYRGEPPLSAVEDLALITDAGPSSAAAQAVLTTTVKLAAAGTAPAAVLDAVRADLAALGIQHRPALDELEGRLAESLAELMYLLPTLADTQRKWLGDEFATQFADAAALLGGVRGS